MQFAVSCKGEERNFYKNKLLLYNSLLSILCWLFFLKFNWAKPIMAHGWLRHLSTNTLSYDRKYHTEFYFRALFDRVSWNQSKHNGHEKGPIRATQSPKAREKTRAAMLWLVLVLHLMTHLIGWASSASFLDQSQSGVKQQQSNLGFDIFNTHFKTSLSILPIKSNKSRRYSLCFLWQEHSVNTIKS